MICVTHLHLNAKSACLQVCACGGLFTSVGRLGGCHDDEQTLQGRISSHYPQFPDVPLRQWTRLNSSHGQKWVESLTRFIKTSQTPCPLSAPLLAPCPHAPYHPASSHSLCYLLWCLHLSENLPSANTLFEKQSACHCRRMWVSQIKHHSFTRTVLWVQTCSGLLVCTVGQTSSDLYKINMNL